MPPPHSLTATGDIALAVPWVFVQRSRYVRACGNVTLAVMPWVAAPIPASIVQVGAGDGEFEYVQSNVTALAAFGVTPPGVAVNVAIAGAPTVPR